MPNRPAKNPARPEIPLLIGLPDLVRMLPVAKQTVYRWRVEWKEGQPKRPQLPEPDLIVARSPENEDRYTPLWFEGTIRDFLEPLGYELNPKELRKIAKDQGHN